jgi:tRNA threonylcarbamoyl adenosine modification protein (Sua5/YciO/YrdC/YwlC family)
MIHQIIHPENPQFRLLDQAVVLLKNKGGVCVYPTDTVYGIGACVSNQKALDRIARFLHKDKQRLFSFICSDLSQASTYVKMTNQDFKVIKRHVPGPFTFILPATPYVPKKVCPKRMVVGIRVPDNVVCQELVRLLGEPLANASINLPGRDRGDPDLVLPAVEHDADMMLDIGVLDNPTGSTIVDMTGEFPVVVREGKGKWLL